ncbi:PAS domain-containing protein [Methylobacterium sp. sgz302541]|uniref:PAS domain-containing protein n=1 Tax=unclassified Methylobacterium TaxID=2615210 RepID=UPI003D32FBB4
MADGSIPLLSHDPLTILDASGVLGDWIHDLGNDSIALSERFAAALGIDAARAARGIPMADFLDRMRPLDGARLAFGLQGLRETGGILEARFETLPGAGEAPRTVQMRGRIDRAGMGGPARGRGIAIDATESRAADLGQFERRVNLMAEHAIALRHLIEGLQRPTLTRLVDGVMVQVGFELAQVLSRLE